MTKEQHIGRNGSCSTRSRVASFGWSIDSSQTAALVTNALGMAIDARSPVGTIIHSDQGTQDDLRHFMATQMLASGVPIAIVAQRLKNARISTTLSVYTHAIPAGTAPPQKISHDSSTPRTTEPE